MLLLFYVRLGAVLITDLKWSCDNIDTFSMCGKYFSSCINGLGSKAFNCNIISVKSMEVIFFFIQ